jgi:hypothetical protein
MPRDRSAQSLRRGDTTVLFNHIEERAMGAIRRSWVIAVLFGVNALVLSAAVWSQQKFPLKEYDSDGGYVEERAIDVGDTPGHQVRIYQLKYKYPKKDLVFLGIPVKESTSSGISDYTNWSGQFTTYNVYVLEDGSKIFSRGLGSNQSGADGARKFSFVENFVGGTGKFRGIRGQLRGSGERAPGAKSITESQAGEYWIEE